MTKERDSLIDVVKGIGIISIVIGHASWEISIAGYKFAVGPFVYLYHLAVFLFCSGCLYKDNYETFEQFIAKKIKGLMYPFITYSIIYLCCRNIFLGLGILDGKKFTLGELAIHLTNIVTFNSINELLSAFWFVPMMFFSIIIFAAIRFLTRWIEMIRLREISRCVLYVVVGLVGLYTTEQQYGLLYNMQISYLLLPVLAIGYYFNKHNGKRFVNIFGLGFVTIIMIFVLKSDIGIIELSKFMIINKYLFYPVTFCGIYFCLGVAKYITRIKVVEKALSCAGRYSFDIMAMHFLAFKLVDFVVCNFRGEQVVLSVFPHSYVELWPLYYIIGVVFPIIVRIVFDKIVRVVINKICNKR